MIDADDKSTHSEGCNIDSSGAVSLLVSIVIYRPDEAWLAITLTSLFAALDVAHDAATEAKQGAARITHATVALVDNEATESESPHHATLIRCLGARAWVQVLTLAGHGNIGYGAANNRAVLCAQPVAQPALQTSMQSPHDYVLILNPDVALDPDSISSAIDYLRTNNRTVLVSPVAVNELGRPLYLAYRYPSVLALGLRGFAPEFVKRLFKSTLAHYQYRSPGDTAFDGSLINPALVSGCFMLTRGSAFRAVGGFDENFFLYFEDFDLALRIGRVGDMVRLPTCRITHAGGGAARKGLRHIRLFCRSAVRFFNKHGWQWW